MRIPGGLAAELIAEIDECESKKTKLKDDIEGARKWLEIYLRDDGPFQPGELVRFKDGIKSDMKDVGDTDPVMVVETFPPMRRPDDGSNHGSEPVDMRVLVFRNDIGWQVFAVDSHRFTHYKK